MFCRNCGNKLADNAKFCNLCGTPVAKPAGVQAPKPSQPAQPASPKTEPVIPPQPQQAPQFQQPQFQRPQFEQPQFEQPQYQQPQYQQPGYPGQPAAQGATPAQQMLASIGSTGKILGLIAAAVCIFLICTVFIHSFDAKSYYTNYSYGAQKYLSNMSKSADLANKNIFSMTIDYIKDGPDSAVFIIGIWSHVVFEAIAAIFVLVGLVRAFMSGKLNEKKMWGALKMSSLASFLGTLLILVCTIASSIIVNVKNDLSAFKNWVVVPNFLAYLFLAVALASLIFCGIMKSRVNQDIIKTQQSPQFTGRY
ncbi:MAG: zinc ribbon domain-containing protein [Ruminococcus sp.]|nr:zinc ribbon domain-containing protein [Ruminococcus sp.]